MLNEFDEAILDDLEDFILAFMKVIGPCSEAHQFIKLRSCANAVIYHKNLMLNRINKITRTSKKKALGGLKSQAGCEL